MRLSIVISKAELESSFREHYKSLCYAANNIVNDYDASEDVVQEVFATLWKKRNDVNISISLKGYLFRATINTSLNYIQKQKRSVPTEEHIIEISSGVSNDVVDNLIHLELEQQLSNAINDLPVKCKTVFMLNRYEDMKYKEVAKHLGISIKTVENQMGKALKRLRLHLQPYLSDSSSNSISS